LQFHGLPLAVFSSLDLLPEEIFGTEEVPEYIFSDPPLKKKTPRWNRGLITNCAAVFGI
jgi:hypothetical protein